MQGSDLPRRRTERSSGPVILPRAAIRSCQRLFRQARRSTCLEQQRALSWNFARIPYWRGGGRNRRVRHNVDNLCRHSLFRLYSKLDRRPCPTLTDTRILHSGEMGLVASILAGST
jgi:hypothetical protein